MRLSIHHKVLATVLISAAACCTIISQVADQEVGGAIDVGIIGRSRRRLSRSMRHLDGGIEIIDIGTVDGSTSQNHALVGVMQFSKRGVVIIRSRLVSEGSGADRVRDQDLHPVALVIFLLRQAINKVIFLILNQVALESARIALMGIRLIVLGEDRELALYIIPSHLGNNQRVGNGVLLILHTSLNQVLKANLVIFPQGELDGHDLITSLPLLEDKFHIVVCVVTNIGDGNAHDIALLVLPGRAVVLVVTHNGGATINDVAVLISCESKVQTIFTEDLHLVHVQVAVVVLTVLAAHRRNAIKKLRQGYLLGIGKSLRI